MPRSATPRLLPAPLQIRVAMRAPRKRPRTRRSARDGRREFPSRASSPARGFARDARNAIAAAQVVAHALAGYDLDGARKGMDGGTAGR
eukprot:gene14786-biopygen1074